MAITKVTSTSPKGAAVVTTTKPKNTNGSTASKVKTESKPENMATLTSKALKTLTAKKATSTSPETPKVSQKVPATPKTPQKPPVASQKGTAKSSTVTEKVAQAKTFKAKVEANAKKPIVADAKTTATKKLPVAATKTKKANPGPGKVTEDRYGNRVHSRYGKSRLPKELKGLPKPTPNEVKEAHIDFLQASLDYNTLQFRDHEFSDQYLNSYNKALSRVKKFKQEGRLRDYEPRK
jgi:hypothetical protein